jgi:hypothetical protein
MDDKPPSTRIDPVLERQVWARQILAAHAGSVVTADLARHLATQFNTASDTEMRFDPLFQTFLQYTGSTLSPSFISILSMQVAARAEELESGPLVLYSHPVRSEWVPLEIVSLEPCAWRNNAPGILLGLRALGGHPAGHLLAKKIPESWLGFLAFQVGCGRRLTYNHEPWILVRTWLWGYLVPDDDHDILNFDKWGISDWMQKRNRTILRPRLRFELKKPPDDPLCPFEFDIDCNACTKGQKECLASLRPE